MRPSEVVRDGSEEELKTEVSSFYLEYAVVNCVLSSTFINSHVFQRSFETKWWLLVHVINSKRKTKSTNVYEQEVTVKQGGRGKARDWNHSCQK